MQRAVFALMFSAVSLAAPHIAPAAEPDRAIYEIRGGVLAHDIDHLWSHTRRESGTDLNAEVTFAPALTLLNGRIRPAIGGSYNLSGDTSKAYIDARWEFDLGSRIFFVIGGGGAVHDGKLDTDRDGRKSLGSRILFHIPVELGYRFDDHHGISLFFDHISNAFLADPNEGMDTLGIRYGYRF